MSMGMVQMRGMVGWALPAIVALSGVLINTVEAGAEGLVNSADHCVDVEAPFTDIPDDHYAAEAVDCLQSLGIVWGTSETTFSPDRPITRAQTAALLARTWRAAGRLCPTANGTPFDDIPAGHRAAADIDCLHGLGILGGVTESRFDPRGTVTRARLANLLARTWRAARFACPVGRDGHSFTDVSAAHWAGRDINCLYDLGVIPIRDGSTEFSPAASVVRADGAVMLARMWQAFAERNPDGFAPDNATLRELRLAGDGADLPLSPVFASGTISYTAYTQSPDLVVSATPGNPKADSTATVSIAPADAFTHEDGHQLRPTVGANTVTIVVTAADGSSTTSTLVVTREASSDATLRSLAAANAADNAGIAISPTFDAGAKSYTARVAYVVEQATIAAVPNHSAAETDLSPADADAETDGHQVDLSEGSNTVTVTVTAQDDTTSAYTLTITRGAASTDADLGSLAVTHGAGNTAVTLSPTFSAGAGSYTATVDHSVDQVTVAAIAEDTQAALSATPADADSGKDGHQTNLGVGETTITITVTAEDGSTIKRYTVAITRKAPLSTDAELTTLTVTDAKDSSAVALTPTFDAATTGYTASVANSVNQVTVAATTNDSEASVSLPTDDNTTKNGTQIDLSVGSNTVEVTVTAEDGTTTKTYTVTVTRAESNDATLSSLALTHGSNNTAVTLTPTFTAGTTSYTASVANSVNQITLAATANHTAATVTLPTDDNTTKNGTQVNLAVGANTITVTATAQDGTTKTYTVTITRGSNDADLKTLTLAHGSNNTAVTLTPTFTAGTTSYTASVANSVNQVTVAAAANHSKASVAISPTDAVSGGSHQVNLSPGSNTITFTVTPESGTSKAYTVTVTRLSNDADLKTLTVTHGANDTSVSLSPTFAAGTTSYTAAVDYSVSQVTVAGTANHSKASVAISPTDAVSGGSHQVDLSAGSNTITVTVTAEDGSTTKAYTVTIARKNTSLASLTIKQGITTTAVTLTPTFARGTFTYTASISPLVDFVTVEATAHDATNHTVTLPTDDKGLLTGTQVALSVVPTRSRSPSPRRLDRTNSPPATPSSSPAPSRPSSPA